MKFKNLQLRLDPKLWKKMYDEKRLGNWDNWEDYIQWIFYFN